MSDFSLTPRAPKWPLRWPDSVLDLQEWVLETDKPAWLVGGAVRDALLGRPVKDLDIVTSEGGMKLARHLANRMKGAYFPLDTERDVGRALIETPEGQLAIDVARFRGDDLLADLTDRDFTFNAMAVDLRGDLNLLIDPTGGEDDAINKLVRRCNPDAIASDPVRALRAVRQSSQLNGRIEKDTLRAVRENAPRLAQVSPERVRDEFIRILSVPDPAGALRVADALGLLKLIVPEVEPLHGLKLPPPHAFDAWNHTLAVVEHLAGIYQTISPQRTDETAAQFSRGMVVMALDPYRARLKAHIGVEWPNERPHKALLLLGALLHDTGRGVTDTAPESVSARIADQRAQGLRLSNRERQRLVKMIEVHPLPLGMPDTTALNMHRFWRASGEAGIDACLLALADHLGTVGPYFNQDEWLLILERVQQLVHAWYERHSEIVEPPVLIDGNGLMRAFRLKRGPVIGQLLDRIREAQVTGDVRTEADALQLARRYLDELSAGS